MTAIEIIELMRVVNLVAMNLMPMVNDAMAGKSIPEDQVAGIFSGMSMSEEALVKAIISAAARDVLFFFAIAFVVSGLALWYYSRSLALTAITLLMELDLWLFGALPSGSYCMVVEKPAER